MQLLWPKMNKITQPVSAVIQTDSTNISTVRIRANSLYAQHRPVSGHLPHILHCIVKPPQQLDSKHEPSHMASVIVNAAQEQAYTKRGNFNNIPIIQMRIDNFKPLAKYV
jgi:hypothetical protein